tara:strand:- start:328 stop:1422 length:1095 start_codon:yes stop_codon:yes gene_type:complete
MFRKGGSAEGGITSGLQAPRQGYDNGKSVQPLNMDQNMAEFLKTASIGDMKAAADQMYTPKERPNYAKRRLGDLMIDFGINIGSQTPIGSGIGGAISTALAAAKDPFEKFKASRGNEELLMQQQAENLDERRAGMFKSLIEGQSDILAEKSGSGRFRDEAAAIELRRIIPRLTELKDKRKNETLGPGEDVELLQLQEEFNLYRKKDVGQEVLVDIYVKGKGERYLPNKIEELYREDLKLNENRKYKSSSDPQLEKDALDAIKKEIQELTASFASGGRAGYANGEMVMKEQVTETMAPGPMAQSDNPISYDQLRARLPAEITDDIVELMSNSAEALEDFAMISSQQDVDLFNQKYSVNLVLPSEA